MRYAPKEVLKQYEPISVKDYKHAKAISACNKKRVEAFASTLFIIFNLHQHSK
jgi:hypothetical protein